MLQTGRAGTTPAFIEQVRQALADHGLIKVRISAASRSDCRNLAQRLAHATASVLVDLTGYVVVLYSPVADGRPAPGGPDAAKDRSEQ
ncbi:MAG: YhbY family RNA-binding protein [Phycisphaerae bacterium]|nr:YhbY family RNA-binding protein [Phycisphaerae bacterium]NUQ47612.1 YhbY family RNA-binding protein [Phycisphaerae bacterium]